MTMSFFSRRLPISAQTRSGFGGESFDSISASIFARRFVSSRAHRRRAIPCASSFRRRASSELLEHEAAVAVDGDVDLAVASELGAVEIDLDDLRVSAHVGERP